MRRSSVVDHPGQRLNRPDELRLGERVVDAALMLPGDLLLQLAVFSRFVRMNPQVIPEPEVPRPEFPAVRDRMKVMGAGSVGETPAEKSPERHRDLPVGI